MLPLLSISLVLITPLMMTSLIFKIIRVNWVANNNCCFLPIKGSMTNNSFMSLVPCPSSRPPKLDACSLTCFDFNEDNVSMGSNPGYPPTSWDAVQGLRERLKAYWSMPFWRSAASDTANEHVNSAAPPPYTTRLSLIQVAHHAWSRATPAPPRRQSSGSRPLMKHVTAVLAQSSITSMRSLVVPNSISLMVPAVPNLAAVKSSKRGTMRPLVAMWHNSTPGRPPT